MRLSLTWITPFYIHFCYWSPLFWHLNSMFRLASSFGRNKIPEIKFKMCNKSQDQTGTLSQNIIAHLLFVITRKLLALVAIEVWTYVMMWNRKQFLVVFNLFQQQQHAGGWGIYPPLTLWCHFFWVCRMIVVFLWKSTSSWWCLFLYEKFHCILLFVFK